MTIQKKRIVGYLDTPWIIQGEDVTLGVQLVDEFTRAPMNLSGVDAARAIFFNEDGTTLEKELDDGIELGDALAGVVAIELTDAETLLLAPGYEQSFQLNVSAGSVTTIVQFLEQLEVRKTLIPPVVII